MTNIRLNPVAGGGVLALPICCKSQLISTLRNKRQIIFPEIVTNLRFMVFAITLEDVSSLKRLKREFIICLEPFIHTLRSLT